MQERTLTHYRYIFNYIYPVIMDLFCNSITGNTGMGAFFQRKEKMNRIIIIYNFIYNSIFYVKDSWCKINSRHSFGFLSFIVW